MSMPWNVTQIKVTFLCEENNPGYLHSKFGIFSQFFLLLLKARRKNLVEAFIEQQTAAFNEMFIQQWTEWVLHWTF